MINSGGGFQTETLRLQSPRASQTRPPAPGGGRPPPAAPPGQERQPARGREEAVRAPRADGAKHLKSEVRAKKFRAHDQDTDSMCCLAQLG